MDEHSARSRHGQIAAQPFQPISIEFLDGPNAGEVKSFGDDIRAIMVGRGSEQTTRGDEDQFQVPAECEEVSTTTHFVITRKAQSTYSIERTKNSYYVEIDGAPISGPTPVLDGQTVRLGSKDGPSFRISIAKPTILQKIKSTLVTATQSVVDTWQEADKRRRREMVAGFSVLSVAIGVVGYFGAVAYFDDFSEAERIKLENSVYLVLVKEGGRDRSIGTAFAVNPTELATNAHVAQEIRGKCGAGGRAFVRNKYGTDFRVTDCSEKLQHPGFLAFEEFSSGRGHLENKVFTDLKVPNTYDVAFIRINRKVPDYLKIASKSVVDGLVAGDKLATAGYPVIPNQDVSKKFPAPTVVEGNMTKLTNFLDGMDPDPRRRLLVNHNLPGIGGVSGSPIIDTHGRVVAIFSGGNELAAAMPAMAHHAQRIDLLNHIREGGFDLAAERTEWDKQTASYARRFSKPLNDFLSSTEPTRENRDRRQVVKEPGVVSARQGFNKWKMSQTEVKFRAEPGYVYGAIADVEHGTLALSFAKFDINSQPETSAAPTLLKSVEIAQDVSVFVGGRPEKDAPFTLHVFRWRAAPASQTPAHGQPLEASTK